MDQHSSDQAPQRRHRRRRLLAALLLGSTVATVGAGASSLAYFTDNSQSSSGQWSSGTIILGVTPTTTWGALNMFPGDTGRQTIHVANTGTGDLRYAMNTAIGTNTNDVASQMTLAIASGTCPATGPVVGDVSASGALGSAAFGDLSTHTGRTLAAGASEDLCFYWTFNSTADDTYQASAVGATFHFYSEQTANNP